MWRTALLFPLSSSLAVAGGAGLVGRRCIARGMMSLSASAGRVVGSAPSTKSELLGRAKSYPYPRPSCSFVYANGHVMPFSSSDWKEVLGVAPEDGQISSLPGLADLKVHLPGGGLGGLKQQLADAGMHASLLEPEGGWFPVLAIGSNAGPRQLLRKYGGEVEAWPAMDCVVPCVRVALHGFDVVFTPIISSYGSCPATLQESIGTCVEVWITYLSTPALKRMHQTVHQEGGYDLVRISGARAMLLQDGDSLSAAALTQAFALLPPCGDLYSYVSRKGCLCLDGASPTSLSEIPALGRTFPELTQPLVLERVRKALAGETESGDQDEDGNILDEWVMANLKDADTRASVNAQLSKLYLPRSGPWMTVDDNLTTRQC